MSQLVINPWRLAPLGIGAPRYVFGAAPRRVQYLSHELVASSIGALGRIRSRVLQPGDPVARAAPAYFETARMAREMYRL